MRIRRSPVPVPVPVGVAAIAGALLVLGAACSPRVSVEAPKEPIHVIVDVNIKHELYVKLEKDAEKVIDQNPDLF
jgi:hypothetical protein